MAETATMINKQWVVGELMKLADAERVMAGSDGADEHTPPQEDLGCLYREMAAADLAHAQTVKIIATRYGYTPVRNERVGIGEAVGRLINKVAGLGADPIERLVADLFAKAEAIHRYAAWIELFESSGDRASSQELVAILADEQRHVEALQSGLNRLVEHAAQRA